MRISDWSSDVCSSDLMVFGRGADAGYEGAVGARHHHQRPVGLEVVGQRHRDAERAHAWHAVLDVPGLEVGVPVEFLGAEARLVVQARLAGVDLVAEKLPGQDRKSTRLTYSH